jgi:antitoxin (DNA-binding transcriptional repressor) of toxin-antitoxin stability system
MHKYWRIIMSRLLLAGLCAPLPLQALPAQTSVRTVKVLGSKDAVEIEVEASDRIVPQTQVLTGPDRLVIDFPNSVPSNQLRSQSVDRGEVKNLRIGLFQSRPPVTRLVLDLKTAQSYQVFPSGRTVIIKVMGGGLSASGRMDDSASAPATRPSLVTANYTTHSEPVMVEAAQPVLDVTYRNGLLGIRANKATLSEVLFAVQQRTGSEISIASGAEQEKVVAEIAPGPAPEVLARLLNGSRFNFLIVSAVDDPQKLDRVILSMRPEGGFANSPLPQVQSNDTDDDGSANASSPVGNPAPLAQPPQPAAAEQNAPDQ